MKKKIILASASERRKELLTMMGINFEISPAENEKKVDISLPIGFAIEEVALSKAKEVFEKYPNAVVLGSDTVVVVDGEILGKPKDKEDARRMLKLLSNRSHEVVTGLAFVSKEETYVTHSKTEVIFGEISDQEIDDYLDTDEPYDKAGAYAIQGKSSVFIDSIHGDVYTVIGLPVHLVYKYLKKRNLI